MRTLGVPASPPATSCGSVLEQSAHQSRNSEYDEEAACAMRESGDATSHQAVPGRSALVESSSQSRTGDYIQEMAFVLSEPVDPNRSVLEESPSQQRTGELIEQTTHVVSESGNTTPHPTGPAESILDESSFLWPTGDVVVDPDFKPGRGCFPGGIESFWRLFGAAPSTHEEVVEGNANELELGLRDHISAALSTHCDHVTAAVAAHGDHARQSFHKGCWQTVSSMGQRRLAALASSVVQPNTIFYFDVEEHPCVAGYVALTIDDAPCRTLGQSMVVEVQALLTEFEATATFFLCTDFVPGHEDELVSLLMSGNEVANHCPEDRSYAGDGEPEFERALLLSEEVCNSLRCRATAEPSNPDSAVEARGRWFRAPHASLSSTMQAVVERHGFTHVLSDCYANDPWIGDPEFIADRLVEDANDGSILCIHMPERGFREYNLQALRKVLMGLQGRGLKAVTASSLRERAQECTRPCSQASQWSYSIP